MLPIPFWSGGACLATVRVLNYLLGIIFFVDLLKVFLWQASFFHPIQPEEMQRLEQKDAMQALVSTF